MAEGLRHLHAQLIKDPQVQSRVHQLEHKAYSKLTPVHMSHFLAHAPIMCKPSERAKRELTAGESMLATWFLGTPFQADSRLHMVVQCAVQSGKAAFGCNTGAENAIRVFSSLGSQVVVVVRPWQNVHTEKAQKVGPCTRG